MTGLIKESSEIQKYVRVAGTFKASSFLPFVVPAQKKLIPYTGSTLLESLDNWYNSEKPETNDAYEALLPYVQDAIAKFTLSLAAPSVDTILTESGFAVVSNQNLAPASDKRVKSFIDSMDQLGWACVESLLQFLEANKSDYDEWTESDAYTEYYNNFITTAVDFDKIIRIDQSRLRFMQMKPSMDNVEILRIDPVISKAMADDIKAEIKEGNELSEEYLAIHTNIKRAVAYYTMFEETKDKKYEEKGDAFLAEVKKTIDANPDNYTLYASSDCYDSEKTSYNNFENKEENKLFSFGSHF
jgi:hypothetical protein